MTSNTTFPYYYIIVQITNAFFVSHVTILKNKTDTRTQYPHIHIIICKHTHTDRHTYICRHNRLCHSGAA